MDEIKARQILHRRVADQFRYKIMYPEAEAVQFPCMDWTSLDKALIIYLAETLNSTPMVGHLDQPKHPGKPSLQMAFQNVFGSGEQCHSLGPSFEDAGSKGLLASLGRRLVDLIGGKDLDSFFFAELTPDLQDSFFDIGELGVFWMVVFWKNPDEPGWPLRLNWNSLEDDKYLLAPGDGSASVIIYRDFLQNCLLVASDDDSSGHIDRFIDDQAIIRFPGDITNILDMSYIPSLAGHKISASTSKG